MPDNALLLAFIPTFFVVSLTPGMAMTLALTTGMTQGLVRALWMAAGELLGVGIVATSAAVGVAALMLNFPVLFTLLKIIGGLYLLYLGLQLWRSRGRLAISGDRGHQPVSRRGLAWQGFVTAIANPKGWAFFSVLLPPFLTNERPVAEQLPVLILIILLLEFLCLMIYAGGGRSLSLFLNSHGRIRLLNRLAGSLMGGVGIWLMAG